jgi:LmbE family N-acetylglucosaminyl deacetylase
MIQSILILAAHPDDEVLGCGGTIAKLVDEGAIVHVAFLADGVFSRAGEEQAQRSALVSRRAAAQKACEILGVKSVSSGDFPDNRMDTIPPLDITQAVEMLISKHQLETIFTHHAGDVTINHIRKLGQRVRHHRSHWKEGGYGSSPKKLYRQYLLDREDWTHRSIKNIGSDEKGKVLGANHRNRWHDT